MSEHVTADRPGQMHPQGILSSAGALRLMEDVNLLLDFVGRCGNARLDACFEDTRGNATMPPDLPVPPIPTKRTLAATLARIARAMEEGQLPDPDEVALLMATRDLLARAVAPVTVDTIRLTAAYERARAAPNWLMRAFAGVARSFRHGAYRAPPDGRARTVDRLGSQLAGTVLMIQIACAFTVFATVSVSTLVLTGKLVLEQRARVAGEYAAVARDVSTAQKDEMRGSAVPLVTNGAQLPPARMMHYCDLSARDASGRPMFMTQRQAELCPVYWGTNQRMNDANLHLALWNSVFTSGFSGQVLGIVFGVPAQGIPAIAQVGGADPDCGWFPSAPPQRPGTAVAGLAATPRMLDARQEPPCESVYRSALVRSSLVAEAVIGGVSQYVLPCLYALLGAFAAVLRSISSRADAAQLTRSERSRAMQSLLLGVLFGAVIGLFTTVLGSTGETTVALSVNAVALLAGYSVGGVFAFFDLIVLRLFGRPA